MSAEILPEKELFKRIEVRPPYYALRDVHWREDGQLQARVPVEQPLNREVPPIAAAEVGRHLAILGSCYLALKDPAKGKEYFLAQEAELTRHNLHDDGVQLTLEGRATGERQGSGRATATATLHVESSDPLFTLRVGYRVLSARAFERLFKGQKRDMRRRPRSERPELHTTSGLLRVQRQRHNPFRDQRRLHDLSIEGDTCTARLGEVPDLLCKGHFPQFPALPVAILMYSLSRVAEEWLVNELGPSAKYVVTHGLVSASVLAFAGDSVQLRSVCLGESGGTYRFQCEAMSREGAPVGGMTLSLRRM